MSDYDEAVKKGAIYVPGYNPPAGTMAAEQKRREEAARLKKSSGGSGGNSGGCFVATAVYGDFDAPEVLILRKFRDQSLRRSGWGRTIIHTYYALSPPLAKFIAKSAALRGVVRELLLKPLILLISRRKAEER